MDWVSTSDDLDFDFTQKDYNKALQKAKKQSNLETRDMMILNAVQLMKAKSSLKNEFQAEMEGLRKEIANKDKLIDQLKNQLKKQEETITEERNQRIIKEKKECKRSVIISGVVTYIRSGEKTEKEEDTLDIVKLILKAIKCKVGSIACVERFKKKEQTEDGTLFKKCGKKDNILYLNIKLTFSSVEGKLDFFKSLKFLAKSSYKDAKVSVEYPSSLREDLKRLNKEAFELRQKGFKTRVFTHGVNLVLKVKEGDRWIKAPEKE